MSKIAVLQVADTGPLESLVVMLRSVGYDCYLPSESLKTRLRSVFGKKGLVLDVESLVRGMGYERPFNLPTATNDTMKHADLYVDVKAHRITEEVVSEWPNLSGKVLWYRINGARPEHVVNARGDHGDEVNPPCPVLTPNQWYREEFEACHRCDGSRESPPGEQCWECDGSGERKVDWHNVPRYVCWPPFVRFGDYYDEYCRFPTERPVCLIHNLQGWGYGALVENMRTLGVACLGAGSPDGLVNHSKIPLMLSRALCMVHLKSNDAPGYALYEALAAACPVICTRRLIWRCRMQDLLIPGKTCLVFDRETHDGLSERDVKDCTAEVAEHLLRLSNPVENQRIGMAGHERLKQVMWSADRAADVASLQEFMARNYP